MNARTSRTRANSSPSHLFFYYPQDNGDNEAAEPMNGAPVISRPISNVTTEWTTFDYTNIDEVVEQPTAGDGSSVAASNADQNTTQSYGLSDPEHEATNIFVWIYGRKGSTVTDPSVSLTIGGVETASQNIGLTTSDAWHGIEFTGTWSASELASGYVVNLIASTIPSGFNFIFIDTVYTEAS